MSRYLVLLSVLVITLSIALPGYGDEFVHEARVMGKLGNHPNIVTFIGAITADVSIVQTATGNNPVYQEQGGEAVNPLYEGSADPGSPNGIQSISFLLDNTAFPPSTRGEGVIHRDIAARNILITTNGGVFASAPGESFLFGNDGGPAVQGSGVGPIRWMAPESLRLFSPGPGAGPGDYFDLLPGSILDVNYVPEPATATLAVSGFALAFARRRQPR